MMRALFQFVFPLWAVAASAQPVLIHSHNDYQQAEPLTNALRNQAYTIEADVYWVNNNLLVAHTTNELSTAPTLQAMYLQPIVALFLKNKNHVSKDSNYAPNLMIDIKNESHAVLLELVKELSAYPSVFNRAINPKAIKVVISGERGLPTSWQHYPSFIFFDGRPNEKYDSAALQRVGFISDSYAHYNMPADSIDNRIKQLANQTHQLGKLLRLWAIPDNPSSWDHLRQLGVDIINTDKVAECREYFSH